MANDKKIAVTVVGGGIAGITSALRLAQRGYSVTLYEAKSELGGNLAAFKTGPPLSTPGATEPEKLWHDVYPHMFSTFYHNFWDIVEKDLCWRREEHFQPRDSVKVWKEGKYIELTDGATLRKAWQNLYGGLLPPADMIAWAYSKLDLLSDPVHGQELANAVTVNSFIESRPYGTARAAKLYDFVLMVIWSAHSYQVPASAYRDFSRFSFREPAPWTWVLRGDLNTHLIAPLEEELKRLEVKIKKNHRIINIEVSDQAQVTEIQVLFEERKFNEKVDNLILAVNPQVAGLLAQSGGGSPGLAEYVPALSQTRQAHADPILVIDAYFKKKVPNIPRDHVSLWNSPLNLSFLDLSQVWKELEGGPTVLTIAASNFYGLPAPGEHWVGAWEDTFAIGRELKRVNPLIDWADVDVNKSVFQPVEGHALFLNTPGSETWRPRTHYDALPNLFLAGAYVQNPVSMATVEGAVTSGLQAAQALYERTPQPGAWPVEIIPHESYPLPMIHALKLATMPAAYQAKWWSAMSDAVRAVRDGQPPVDRLEELASLWALPAHMVTDLWKTSTALFLSPWDASEDP